MTVFDFIFDVMRESLRVRLQDGVQDANALDVRLARVSGRVWSEGGASA